MSDIVIRAEQLTKVYRLYRSPSDRIRDAFGLLRDKGRYSEHVALDGIDIVIRRREKVGIIGRNGAGKSTLLKLITRTIEPTSGVLEVNGATQALLQIGTGFHPEFTGRENVISYLAQLGIAAEKAERLTREIIEFAEVEEYIDQPVKTYSTGMGARLMFAASTVIEPDVLVIDEVLGVGDAYFARKSYERIKSLCSEHNSTLILVSHDIYSTAQICDRMIWIDKGKVVIDGPCPKVMEAYERSIRRQEELRLNRRAIVQLRQELTEQGLAGEAAVGRIADAGDVQSARPAIWVSHLSLARGGDEVLRIDVPAAQGKSVSHLILDAEKGNWGEPAEHAGRRARPFARHGSIFHRLPFALSGPGIGALLADPAIRIRLGVFATAPHEIDCVIVHPELARLFGARQLLQGGVWEDLELALSEDSQWGVAEARGETIARYGSRRMEISDVQFIGRNGAESHVFSIGEPLRVRLSYRINDPAFDEKPLIVVAFMKDGAIRAHRFWHDGVSFGPESPREGTIEIAAQPLLLGAGKYLVNVSLFREGYMTSAEVHGFFTSNPGVLDMHSRGYELVVAEDPEWRLFNDALFQHPSAWRVNGMDVAQPERAFRRGFGVAVPDIPTGS